jgi:hypothetical protein
MNRGLTIALLAALALGGVAWWLLRGGADGGASQAEIAGRTAAGPAGAAPTRDGPAQPVAAAPFTEPEAVESSGGAGAAAADGSVPPGHEERGPFLSGRVVDGAGKPVPGAGVNVVIGDRRTTTARGFVADDRGRFRAMLRLYEAAPTAEFARIEIVPPGAAVFASPRVHELDVKPGFTQDRDVGDLAFGAFRRLTLVVVDDAGKPVAGARLCADEQSPIAKSRTDESGRAELLLPETDAALILAAVGFERGRIVVPAGAASPFTVTLARGALIEVSVRTPEGNPAPGLVVRFDGPPGFLRFVDVLGEDVYARITAGVDAGVGGRIPWAAFRTDESGLVRLGDLEPGSVVRTTVSDGFGTFELTAETTVGPGEPRIQSFTTPSLPRSFVLRALDEEGQPVDGAEIDFAPAHGGKDAQRGLHVRADAAGRATFAHVYATGGRLVVDAERRLKTVLDPFPTPENGATVDVTVRAGRRVALSVVDDSGAPVAIEHAWAVHPAAGRTHGASAAADGKAVLVALPDDEVTLKARVGGAEYATKHDARVAEARLVVPAHGKLTLRLGAAGREGDLHRVVRLSRLDGDRSSRAFVPALQADRATGDLTVDPLPAGRYRVDFMREPPNEPTTRLAPTVEVEVPARGTAEAVVGG